MTIIKFPSSPDQPPFFKDIIDDGYHIFSLKNAKIPDYYPNEFPDYPDVKIKDLQKDDIITIKIFFVVSGDEDNQIQIESEYINLEVVFIYDDDSVVAEVMTELPGELLLEKYDSLELYEEEIIGKNNTKKPS